MKENLSFTSALYLKDSLRLAYVEKRIYCSPIKGLIRIYCKDMIQHFRMRRIFEELGEIKFFVDKYDIQSNAIEVDMCDFVKLLLILL